MRRPVMKPFSPKLVMSLPSFGSIAARPLSVCEKMRGPTPLPPGQYVRSASRRAGRLVLPDLRAGRGVERVHAVRRAEIHDAVDDDQAALEEAGGVARVERPRALQVLDVVGVDLRQRRELRRARILAERAPVVLCGGRSHGDEGQRGDQGNLSKSHVSSLRSDRTVILQARTITLRLLSRRGVTVSLP